MKQKDLTYVFMTAFLVAIFAYILAGVIFKSPASRSAKVPVVQAIKPSFPDIKNDPAYNSFLNTQAIDPTQNIQIGNNQNSAPFSQ